MYNVEVLQHILSYYFKLFSTMLLNLFQKSCSQFPVILYIASDITLVSSSNH